MDASHIFYFKIHVVKVDRDNNAESIPILNKKGTCISFSTQSIVT